MRWSREPSSNDIDEKELQKARHQDPITSTLLGMVIDVSAV
jgi:hypothetical protein